MIYQLITTEAYEKKLAHFLRKHREIIKAYEKTLELLEINPYHPSLRLHSLQGNLGDYHSVSINLKYRIVIDFFIENQEITLIDINKHYE